MTTEDLRKAGLNVRASYFPRWDCKERWRIQLDRTGATRDGQCDKKRMRISINPSLKLTCLPLILIHEIAHAVTRGGHGLKWQARMMKAASLAKKLGDTELASSIIAEVDQYQESPETTVNEIYEFIEDTVCELPTASFEAVTTRVTEHFGFSREHFRTHYARAREIYGKATRLFGNF